MTFPSPLPSWFWPWVRWRRGVGEFTPYGPANPAVRPPNAPAKIPKWAWLRLKLNIFGTGTPIGIFGTKGAMLRNPRGGVENYTEQKSCVYYTACNTGDHTMAEWSMYLQGADAHGIKVIPWARCLNANDVVKLINVAETWSSKGLIVNLEIEAKNVLPPSLVAEILKDYAGQVAISTEAWLYNPPVVNWTPLNKYTMMLQIFPQESDPSTRPLHCIAHAQELGFKNVVLTYGSYAGGQASWFNLTLPYYNIYTGDDIGVGNWKKWFP